MYTLYIKHAMRGAQQALTDIGISGTGGPMLGDAVGNTVLCRHGFLPLGPRSGRQATLACKQPRCKAESVRWQRVADKVPWEVERVEEATYGLVFKKEEAFG